MNHDEDPLDLLDDDGDGVNEICLLFDGKEENNVSKPTGRSGCCIAFLLIGTPVIAAGVSLVQLFTA